MWWHNLTHFPPTESSSGPGQHLTNIQQLCSQDRLHQRPASCRAWAEVDGCRWSSSLSVTECCLVPAGEPDPLNPKNSALVLVSWELPNHLLGAYPAMGQHCIFGGKKKKLLIVVLGNTCSCRKKKNKQCR